MKIFPVVEEPINVFFDCTMGHLTMLFVSALGHLPVYLSKMLMPRKPGEVGGGGGGVRWGDYLRLRFFEII